MKMAHTELDLCERYVIENMFHAKVPVSKIAVEIGTPKLPSRLDHFSLSMARETMP
jgi:hypothetical protein